MKRVKRILICVVTAIGLISNYAAFAQSNVESSDIKSNITTSLEETDISQKVDFTSQIDLAKKTLKSLTVKNETQESDIVGAVKDKIDSSISVSFGDNNEKFNKIEATSTKEGSITGTLILQDTIGNKKAIIVDLTLDKLQCAEDKKDSLSLQPENMQKEQEVTTGSAAVITTTGTAVIVDYNEPTSLKAEIEGTVSVGNTIDDKVTGYNAEGNQVDLNEDNINYKWIEAWKDENGNENSKEVGESKQLVITKDMDGKDINCQVSYDDGKGENK